MFFYIGDKTLPVCVDCRNPRCPVKHDGPLARGTPMQLADASRSSRTVTSRPSAFVNTLVRKREWIFEVLNQAFRVRGRRPDGIRVLAIKPQICRAGVAPAPVRACDLLQCGNAANRNGGFPYKVPTSKRAHN